jgi:translation initiation factor 5A
VYPVKHKVKSPIIDKRKAQVLVVMGDEVQLMDTETYETFELPIPENLRDRIEPGKEVEYWEAMGKRVIMKA